MSFVLMIFSYVLVAMRPYINHAFMFIYFASVSINCHKLLSNWNSSVIF